MSVITVNEISVLTTMEFTAICILFECLFAPSLAEPIFGRNIFKVHKGDNDGSLWTAPVLVYSLYCKSATPKNPTQNLDTHFCFTT